MADNIWGNDPAVPAVPVPTFPQQLADTALPGASLVGFDGTDLASWINLRVAKVVLTLAELRTVDKTKYSQVLVVGYTAAGDVPLRHFYLKSSGTENGITTVVAYDGGIWGWTPPAEGIDARFAGIKADGATDNGAAINALAAVIQAAGAGTILLQKGVTCSTLQHLFNFPIRFVGAGDGNAAWTGFSATVGSELKYIGASTSGSFIEFRSINGGGWGIERVKINGNSLAAQSVLIDSCVYGAWKQFYVTGATVRGMRLLGTYGTCSWNTFENYRIDGFGSDGALRLSGYVGQGNACHNTFMNGAINFGGSSHGLILGGCDNNTFVMTYQYAAPGATGYGSYVDPTEQTNFPINNAFYHLQASTRGWYQPATTAACPAAIYGYAQDNGQPWPVTNGTFLVVHGLDRGGIQIASGASFGRSRGNNFFGASVITAGNYYVSITFSNGNEPDTNYSIFPVFTNNPPTGGWCIRNRTVSGFELALSYTPASNMTFEFFVVRV